MGPGTHDHNNPDCKHQQHRSGHNLKKPSDSKETKDGKEQQRPKYDRKDTPLPKTLLQQKLAAAQHSSRKQERKSFADSKEDERNTQLLKAIKDQNEAEVKRLTRKEGYNVNFVDEDDPYKSTPLHLAVLTGNCKIARYLLKAKRHPAKVNVEDHRKFRPVWIAALKGDFEMAEILTKECSEKCEVNFVEKISGMTPLYRAIVSKSPETCRALVHAGADVNMRRFVIGGATGSGADAGETPLIKAVELNNLAICEVLVNSLVDLQAKTSSGFTALHYSVAYRRYDVTKYLLDERIKMHAKAKSGITAMTIAIAEDLPAMVNILVNYGYNIDKRFEWGETPLEMCLARHTEECALILLKSGCSLQLKSKNKPSYFKMACFEGLSKVIKFLVGVKPRFLQEQWLRKKQMPLALYKEVDLYEWLLHESIHVTSLLNLCYAKLFVLLGKHVNVKVEKLPLPEKLKEWFKFDDYFTGKFVERKYREKSIFSHECPYDCGMDCERHHCVDIEFSDSGTEHEFDTDSENNSIDELNEAGGD